MPGLPRGKKTRPPCTGADTADENCETIHEVDYGLSWEFSTFFRGGDDPSKPRRYVICFMDQASMFQELCAVSDISAPTIIRELFDHIITRYGVSKGIYVQSDNGSGFIARLTSMFVEVSESKTIFQRRSIHRQIHVAKSSGNHSIRH
jgi:hypothetical protein